LSQAIRSELLIFIVVIISSPVVFAVVVVRANIETDLTPKSKKIKTAAAGKAAGEKYLPCATCNFHGGESFSRGFSEGFG